MSEILDFFLDSILKPLAFLLLGVLAGWLISYVKKRRNPLVRALPFRLWHLQFLPPRIIHEKINITYGLIPPSVRDMRYFMVEEGDVSALYKLVSLFEMLYGLNNVEVENCHDATVELQRIANLVTLSGPIWNPVTELYIGLFGSPVVFQMSKGDVCLVIKDKSGGSELMETTYTEGHRPKKCYGILLAGSVKGAHEQTALLMAGSSNLSTYGSALLLWAIYRDKEIQQKLSKYQLWKEKRWLVIFSIENWAEGSSEHSQIPSIKTGVLKLSVVRVFLDKDFLEPYEYHLERTHSKIRM